MTDGGAWRSAPTAAASSPAVSDGTLRLWDAQTGQPIGAPLTGHQGCVGSVAFSPDGRRLVSGGDDGTLRLWDARDRAADRRRRSGHHGVRAASVAVQPRRPPPRLRQ